MHLCSNLCANVAFIVTKILQRPDIQGKWFNACIKLIKRLCMMSVVALLGHILNKIFAQGIGFETEKVFQK